jgi:hypothetical protein
MSDQRYEALETCLKALDEGLTLDQCLEKYPALAGELRPALEAAYAARKLAVTDIPVGAMNRSRTYLLGKAALLRQAKPSRRIWMGLPRLAFSLVLALVLLVLTSSSLLAASSKSLPGDRLYPVKRAVENLRIQFAPSGVQKYEAEWQYREQRIGEIKELLTMGQERSISFEGVVEQIAELDWLVSGLDIRLTANTVLIGSIKMGMLVEVEGLTQADGYVLAREIHLREYQFSGVVDSKNINEWVISGLTLQIVPETQIGPNIRTGDPVLVLARSDNDAEWKAIAILSLGESEETATPTPSAASAEGLASEAAEQKAAATLAPDKQQDDSEDEQSTSEPKGNDGNQDSKDDKPDHKLKRKGDKSGCGSDKKDNSDCGFNKPTPKPKDDKDGSGDHDQQQTPEPEDKGGDSQEGNHDSIESSQEPEEPPALDE